MFHKGKDGKSYANPQVRDHADRTPMKVLPMKHEMQDGEENNEEMHESDVPSHLEELHASMGGKHMHAHQGEDGEITSHHIGEDGMVEGPHHHADAAELADHMHKVFGDDGGEGMHEESEAPSGGGLRHALAGM